MKYSFSSALSSAQLKCRLSNLTIPLTAASKHQKSARLCRCKGKRFTLVQNGETGMLRPSRVFRGRILADGEGAIIRGRFGLSSAARGMILLPCLLIGGLAAAFSLSLPPSYKAIFYGATVISLAVPFLFASMVSQALHAAHQKELLCFLETNIAGGIDPEPEPNPGSAADSEPVQPPDSAE